VAADGPGRRGRNRTQDHVAGPERESGALPAWAAQSVFMGGTKMPIKLMVEEGGRGELASVRRRAGAPGTRGAVLVCSLLFLAACGGATSSSSEGATTFPGRGAPSSSSPPVAPTWRRIDLPDPRGGATGYQWSAIACSSIDACLVGGTEGDDQTSVLESTANAGHTWTGRPQLPPSMSSGIESAACEQQDCLIVADNPAANGTTIGRTSDGASTWSILPNPPMWATASISATLVACSASRCLVEGDNTFAISPGDTKTESKTSFVETSDDGHSWTEIHVPGATQIERIACVWSGECWALYESTDWLEHVAATTDGGLTWSVRGSVDLNVDHLVGFACQSAQTCFIIDDSNALTMTRDGGLTWAAGPAPRDAQGSADFATDAMTCTPASTCWIISGEANSAWILPPGP